MQFSIKAREHGSQFQLSECVKSPGRGLYKERSGLGSPVGMTGENLIGLIEVGEIPSEGGSPSLWARPWTE